MVMATLIARILIMTLPANGGCRNLALTRTHTVIHIVIRTIIRKAIRTITRTIMTGLCFPTFNSFGSYKYVISGNIISINDPHSHGEEYSRVSHGHSHGVEQPPNVPLISVAPHSPSSHVRSQSLGFAHSHMQRTPSQSDHSKDTKSDSRHTNNLSIGSFPKQSSPLLLSSPLTPSYEFGHDDHFATHHHAEHVPNLHDHAHVHEHHEGHSHNMRGVFLHIMAVRLNLLYMVKRHIYKIFIGYTRLSGCDNIDSPYPVLWMDGF